MKRYTPFVVMLATILMLGYGCKHKPQVTPQQPISSNNGGGNGSNGTNDSTICFERDILPIFISNCTNSGCHDAISKQDGYQFTDYNSIVSKDFVAGNADKTELYEKITEDKQDKIMPPPPNNPLTTEQIALIRRWINEGAKNTTCTSDCDTSKFTYSEIVQPILTKNCVGCHNMISDQKGVILDSYTETFKVAQSGRLLKVIKHESGVTAMPLNGKLLDCDIKLIEKWVNAGMLNN